MDLREEDIKKFQDFINLNIRLHENKISTRQLAEKSLTFILEILGSETSKIPLLGQYINDVVKQSIPMYLDYARKRLGEDYDL